MNRSVIIAGAILAGFVAYVIANGSGAKYLALLEPSPQQPQPLQTFGTSSIQAPAGTSLVSTTNVIPGVGTLTQSPAGSDFTSG